MKCVKCGLPLHRGRDGKCYYCKRQAEEAQTELEDWVPRE